MGGPAGFAFSQRGDTVMITHHGRKAVTLRGSAAARFLEDVELDDPQQVMARATGDYKRGNDMDRPRPPTQRLTAPPPPMLTGSIHG